MSEQKEESLEELFEKVEGLLGNMEKQDVSLEDSFVFYEQGIKYLQQCQEKIDLVEKKMQVLTQQGQLIEE